MGAFPNPCQTKSEFTIVAGMLFFHFQF